MSIIKSLSVGNGDMFYIKHNSDNFTIIDCCMPELRSDEIITELREVSNGKTISRLISTHPDEDHISGLVYLNKKLPVRNFYCVDNAATKSNPSLSFLEYCALRDNTAVSFKISKGSARKWMNIHDDLRGSSGINVLWPDLNNSYYKFALSDAAKGVAFNNMCPIIRYQLEGGASFLWIGDLETSFMEIILDSVVLTKTTVVFAPHHGRDSGKIPHSWLEKLDPQVIVIGEAPSRHLNYYTGYKKITQNKAGDITFECLGNKVHMYASNSAYGTRFTDFDNLYQDHYVGYLGSFEVETEYTLE